MNYRRTLRFTLAMAGALLLSTAAWSARADAQQTICSGDNFGQTAGTTACDGSSSPMTTTATVETSATLKLATIFGSSASSLTVPFGAVDAYCVNTPGTGISCSKGTNEATWYGDIAFTVELGGLTTGTAKLTALRPSAGTVPAGQLLDGTSAGVPATAYTVSPTAAIALRTGMTNGTTTVTRAFGVKVKAADAAASWSSTAQYSLVIE